MGEFQVYKDIAERTNGEFDDECCCGGHCDCDDCDCDDCDDCHCDDCDCK